MNRINGTTRAVATLLTLLAISVDAQAQELCGDGVDNDSSGGTDNGCNPAEVTGVCEQAMSCDAVGAIAPLTGGLVDARQADLHVQTPYGAPLEFRRTYVGRYVPRDGNLPGGMATFTQPIGPRWRHDYMSWVAASGADRVLHTDAGLDILYTFDHADAIYDYYAPQAGYYMMLRQRHGDNRVEYQTEDGMVREYAWSGGIGKLDRIHQVGHATAVTITYNAGGQIWKVTDESNTRWLELVYNGANHGLLEQVKLWATPASPVLQSTILLAYDTSSQLTSVSQQSPGTSGPVTLESYAYDPGGDLLSATLGAETANGWAYRTSGGVKRIARAGTGEGTMGFAYGACDSGAGNYQFFQKKAMPDCTADAQCGGGFCGGIDDFGAGKCFAARRCVSYTEPNEPLPTTITASCAGCADTLRYVWDSGTGNDYIHLLGRQDTDGRWTSFDYGTGTHGHAEKTVFDDTDSDHLSEPLDSTVVHHFYSSTCPGLLTERRIHSELKTGGCNRFDVTACKQSIFTYNADCKVATSREKGYTFDENGTTVPYDYLKTFTYDPQGRLTDVEGPLAGADGFTMTFWPAGADVGFPMSEGMLKELKLKKGGSAFLTTTYNQYSQYGPPGRAVDPNGKVSCMSYSATNGKLSVLRKIVDGPSSCIWTAGPNDERTNYARHADGRLSMVTFPEGNCLTFGYSAEKRLTGITVGDFDGSNCSTVGAERLALTYDGDGNVTLVEYKDGAGVVKASESSSYDELGRLRTIGNPASPGSFQELVYNALGQLTEHRAEDIATSGAKTGFAYSPAGKLNALKRFTGLLFDQYTLTPGTFVDEPTQVVDPMGKPLDMVWDDMERQVKQRVQGVTTLYVWDATNLVKYVQGFQTADAKTTSYNHDGLGRVTAVDTAEAPCNRAAGAEIQYSYDALPPGTSCASGSTCDVLAGRPSLVKTKLSCETVCTTTDCRFDRITFKSYTATGRLKEETTQDDSSLPQKVAYTYTKNGMVKRIDYPNSPSSGVEYVYGRLDGVMSNDDEVITVKRGVAPYQTTILDQVAYFPFGPLKEYRQQNGWCHGSPCTFQRILVSFARNAAYRVQSIHARSQNVTPQDIFKIIYAEDTRGRYTKRDFLNGRDAFYRYSALGRVLCQTSVATASCPGAGGAGLTETLTYNASGDRTALTTVNGTFNNVFIAGTDQIDRMDKSGGGTIEYTYDARGNRIADDDSSYSADGRTYTYDGRNNLISISGAYYASGSSLSPYVMTFAYDHRNRRIFKSFTDLWTGTQTQWFYYYDQFDHLIQAKHTPNTGNSGTYSVYQWYWLDETPFLYYQTDYPAGTVSRRYLHADDQARPRDAWSWPVGSVSTSNVWRINTGLFGQDTITAGASVFQPLRFPGQIYDRESEAVNLIYTGGDVGYWTGAMVRPGLSDNRFRAYDSFTGTYLQIDPLATETWDSYGYSSQDPVNRTDPKGLTDSETFVSCIDENSTLAADGNCYCNNGYDAEEYTLENGDTWTRCVIDPDEFWGDGGGVGWGAELGGGSGPGGSMTVEDVRKWYDKCVKEAVANLEPATKCMAAVTTPAEKGHMTCAGWVAYGMIDGLDIAPQQGESTGTTLRKFGTGFVAAPFVAVGAVGGHLVDEVTGHSLCH